MIIDDSINIDSVDDIFTHYPEYHQLKLVCKINEVSQCLVNKKPSFESDDNIITLSRPKEDYEIVASAVALNCMDNIELQLYFTFGQNQFKWQRFTKSLLQVKEQGKLILLNAESYTFVDKAIQIFNPDLRISKSSASTIGL